MNGGHLRIRELSVTIVTIQLSHRSDFFETFRDFSTNVVLHARIPFRLVDKYGRRYPSWKFRYRIASQTNFIYTPAYEVGGGGYCFQLVRDCHSVIPSFPDISAQNLERINRIRLNFVNQICVGIDTRQFPKIRKWLWPLVIVKRSIFY